MVSTSWITGAIVLKLISLVGGYYYFKQRFIPQLIPLQQIVIVQPPRDIFDVDYRAFR